MPRRRPEDPEDVDPVRVEVVPRRGLNRQEAARYVGINAPTYAWAARPDLRSAGGAGA